MIWPMRVFQRWIFLWFVIGALESGADDRPNILIILCDDLGYSDLGCYGGEIQTPNLDRLASEGIRLTQFYNNSKCTQTRAALLTGVYHHQSNNLRKPNIVTIAEVLQDSGYSTLMSGKWHLSYFDEGIGTPTQRGFDRYFGFLGGAINFFTGVDYGNGKYLMRLDDEVYPVPKDFYATDAITDHAIGFLDEASRRKDSETGRVRPFFLYAAYNAPHFPLHALPEDIAKYRGTYKMGWDELRRNRYERMVDMGLIEDHWALSERDPVVPAWDSISEERKIEEDLLMSVYAAMVDRLDQNVGRLLNHLETLGVAENTFVMFFSDNGGCPYDFDREPLLPPGPAESARTYNSPWANASNTPFRFYKQWAHEGGISTPCIVRWPKGVPKHLNGTLNRSATHLIDIMPTCVELAGASYLDQFNGKPVLPLEGHSIRDLVKGNARESQAYYWEFASHHAVRQGDWKLVAESGGEWELYNIRRDRSESRNLVGDHPRRVKDMALMYERWAKRVGAKNHADCVAKGPSTQKR